jgi:hypothetical protein
MTDSELLARVRTFDAGPLPVLNGIIIEEDDEIPDPASVLMTVERRCGGWSACCLGDYLDREAGRLAYEPRSTRGGEDFRRRTVFASPAEAFAYLQAWKAGERAKYLGKPGWRTFKEWKAEGCKREADGS